MDHNESQENPERQAARISSIDKEDERRARELGQQMDRCKLIIDDIDKNICKLIASQDYYRKKMRKLGVKRDRYLNLRLL